MAEDGDRNVVTWYASILTIFMAECLRSIFAAMICVKIIFPKENISLDSFTKNMYIDSIV